MAGVRWSGSRRCSGAGASPTPSSAPAATNTVVAPWKRDLEVDTTGWEPGFYVLKLVTGSGWDTLVPYVVSSPTARGTVALVAPATTWQAYNAWGGYSLYEGPTGDGRSLAVSFDRPYNRATGANDYRSAALPIVVRAEQLGIPLSYFTNIDLHERPDALDGSPGLRLDGARRVLDARHASYRHDRQGRRHQPRLPRRQHDVLAGPAGWWSHEWPAAPDDRLPRQRVPRPQAREPAPRRPPGASGTPRCRDRRTTCWACSTSATRSMPTTSSSRRTGGASAAPECGSGDRLPNLVGPEADRVYPDRRTPRPLEVLSNTAYDCRGTTTTSQSVYYTTPSGSGVFAAGTLRWGCAMIDRCERPLGERPREFTRQVTANVLRQFTLGPVADRHPARDNLSHFDLPLANSVTAS